MENQLTEYQRPAWASVIFILLTISIGFVVVGPLVGFLFALPFMQETLFAFADKMKDPAAHSEIKTPLLIVQTVTTFIGLGIGPALYWRVFERKNPFDLLKNRTIPLLIVIVTVFIVLGFMPFNSFIIEWNSNVKFPEFLRGFESWAKENEHLNEQMVKLFTTFDSLGQFAFAFFTISLLAGFCEEFVFRGMLQPQLKRATHNIHAAIWITAILFSAMHLQFYGFIPRVLLGALFGYLYYWSGNLLVPILAHMTNNGIGVIGIYLYQLKITSVDPESTESLPVSVILTGAVITSILLFYFNRFYKTHYSTLS